MCAHNYAQVHKAGSTLTESTLTFTSGDVYMTIHTGPAGRVNVCDWQPVCAG